MQWVAEANGCISDRHVDLAHRRLSIIGLSSGHQPMSNEDDTVWIVFNGEVYNYQEIKEDLLGSNRCTTALQRIL